MQVDSILLPNTNTCSILFCGLRSNPLCFWASYCLFHISPLLLTDACVYGWLAFLWIVYGIRIVVNLVLFCFSKEPQKAYFKFHLQILQLKIPFNNSEVFQLLFKNWGALSPMLGWLFLMTKITHQSLPYYINITDTIKLALECTTWTPSWFPRRLLQS